MQLTDSQAVHLLSVHDLHPANCPSLIPRCLKCMFANMVASAIQPIETAYGLASVLHAVCV